MYKEKKFLVLKVSEIQEKLKLSRTKAYQLCNQNIFPVIRIGNTIRIPVEGFEIWFNQQKKGDER